MDWSSFVAGGIAVPIVVGLSTWLGKVWANRILEKDRIRYQTQMESLLEDLRTRESKELLVHRLQFEKEFEIYRQLWTAVLALGRATREFRDLKIGKAKSQGETLKEFADAFDGLNTVVFDNRPFYAPAVFEKTKAALDLAWEIDRSHAKKALLQEARGDSDKNVEKLIELGEHIEDTLNKINDSIPPICDAIRARIWSTRESGWDR